MSSDSDPDPYFKIWSDSDPDPCFEIWSNPVIDYGTNILTLIIWRNIKLSIPPCQMSGLPDHPSTEASKLGLNPGIGYNRGCGSGRFGKIRDQLFKSSRIRIRS